MREELLTSLARPEIGPRRWPSYVFWGVVGYLAGLILIAARAPEASLWLVLALVPPLVLLADLWLSRKLRRPKIVFYEKALVVLGATMIALAATRQPIVRGLELTALGLGVFLAFGRIGCFSAGCCHGRRARIGVRYRWEHVAIGFPERWVGVRLLPVQLLDGAASAGAVAVALGQRHPLVAYACAYGACRFVLELFRGDATRPYLGGASEAQWIAALSAIAAAAACPAVATIAVASALGAALVLLLVARRSRRWIGVWLLSASHLAEVDRALDRLLPDKPITTSEGLGLTLRGFGNDDSMDVSLSHRERPLSRRMIRTIGRQLGRDWTLLGAGDTLTVVRRVAPDAVIL